MTVLKYFLIQRLFVSMKSGIYLIRSLINGKFYIGSSINVYKRRNRHYSELKNGKHKNRILQAIYNKHGLDNLQFEVVELVENKKLLIEKEQYYINTLKPDININLIANSSLGVKRSEETREKIRQANLGLKHPEWRNKIKSKAQGGKNHWTKKKKFSEESKKKMSESQKNLYKNGYKSPLLGRKRSKETIEKHKASVSKAVLQFDLHGKLIKEWANAKETEKFGFYPTCVGKCCNNKRKTHKGYVWKFK